MAQCFVSTYRHHYRWLDPQVTLSAKPTNDFMNAFPPEEIWIGTEISDDEMNATALEKLRVCYLKRMISTYKVSYCKNMLRDLLGGPSEDSNFESELLRSCKELYEPESRPRIPPPLPNTRKAFGYIRPSDNYTPFTTYQSSYGELAYKLLNDAEEKRMKRRKCCCV